MGADVVSWLCPCGEVPVTTCTEPSGWKRTVALSHPPTAYRTAPRMRDGASPHISL